MLVDRDKFRECPRVSASSPAPIVEVLSRARIRSDRRASNDSLPLRRPRVPVRPRFARSPPDAGYAYEELKADGRTCPVHVYVSTADVDSCCAFRILKSMMCSDGIPFSAYPVGGYQELQNLGDKLPKDGQNRSIVLINCGGTENVKELLGASRAATEPARASPPISNEALLFCRRRRLTARDARFDSPRTKRPSMRFPVLPFSHPSLAMIRPAREHARVRVRQPPPAGPGEHARR